MRRTVGAVALALLVVSTGCLGAIGGDVTASPPNADAGSDGAGDSGESDGNAGTETGETSSVDGPAGTVDFYVSDRPNDMDDFEHLNVTITSVRFHLVEPADGANGSATATTAEPATDTTNATATAVENATDTPTATATATPTAESDDADGDEDDADGDEGAEGQWVVRDVNATTVDLTRLRGANATLVDEFALPAGEYDTVFLEVSEVNGTLTNGESQQVKLPSGKLQLHTQFTVENGSETDFVYDVSVHKAGKSGKYILKPVVSESGVDQPINSVDDEREESEEREENEDEREDEEREDVDSDEREIRASFVGNVTPGENVTVRVTDENGTVANATVTVDGETVGTTDADGEYVVAVPADAEELEIEVEAGDAEAELEREFEGDTEGTETDEGDRGVTETDEG